MIKAEYKNNNMRIEVSGTIESLALELDDLIQEFIEVNPDIINACIKHNMDAMLKSVDRLDAVKLRTITILLKHKQKVKYEEKGEGN
jgi:hypothetical protein